MEYFKRRDNKDRDRGRDRDRDGNRNRRGGGGYRDRNDRSDRGDFEESVYSQKVRAGRRRTYFFDVRQTRGEDFFITITESTRKEDGYGYRRHKIFLYKEDFNRFAESLNDVVNHVKTELMPDFDYEEFDRRQAEWEARMQEERELEESGQGGEFNEERKPYKPKDTKEEEEEEESKDSVVDEVSGEETKETDSDAEKDEDSETTNDDDDVSW